MEDQDSPQNWSEQEGITSGSAYHSILPGGQHSGYAPEYRQRLVKLFWKHEGLDHRVAQANGCLTGLVVYQVVFLLLSMSFGDYIDNLVFSQPNSTVDVSMLSPLLSIIVALVAMSLARSSLTGVYGRLLAKRYKTACSELNHDDLLVRIADGGTMEILQARINEIFGLRWLVPQRPKRIEDLAMWGACFWDVLRSQGKRAEDIPRRSLWAGVLNYTLLRLTVKDCCCVLWFVPGPPLMIPLFIMLNNINIHRSARLYAIIDYLTRQRNYDP